MVLGNKQVSNLDGICSLIFRILQRKDEDCDGCYCCLLLQSIIFNCECIFYCLLCYIALRKQVIPIFVSKIVERFSQPLSKSIFKVLLLEVIETSIGFEPVLTIELLNSLGVLESVYIYIYIY